MSRSKISRRRFVQFVAGATGAVVPLTGAEIASGQTTGGPVTTALNLTLPIKQDPATLTQLANLKANFAEKIQPQIDAALRKSQLVHFARVLVIDDKYIQVLTEFDGDKRAYTDFFLEALPDVFRAVFALADGAPSWEQLQEPSTFYHFASVANRRALGTKADDADAGYLFCGYPGKSVLQILAKFGP